MRDLNHIDKRVMWKGKPNKYGIRFGLMNINGVQASLVVGEDECGWEHVSIELMARRLPTWSEMCEIKNIFWDEEEEVVQIHPKKSEYVNIVDALHLWRPKNGDWSMLNDK